MSDKLREAIANAHWYCVSRDGAPTMCVDEEDAKHEAAKNDAEYPAGAPYKAVRLIDAALASPPEQWEPVAHICILPTKDAGPTKFFTSPSDPRGFPVYAAPAAAQGKAPGYHAWCGSIDDEATLRLAASVMQDVLTDIEGREDTALAEAVAEFRTAILAVADSITAAQPAAPVLQTHPQPLTRERIRAIMTQHYPLDSLLRENVDAFEACVRDIEASLGVNTLSGAALDVLAERQRHVIVEGWTTEHDDQHNEGELSLAAAGYAWAASDQIQCVAKEFDGHESSSLDDPVIPNEKAWPYGWEFKVCPPRHALVKSGALILAEIERLDRAAAPKTGDAA